MAGNRCGHNPNELRTCDIVRRGKGGHPQLLGIISAYLDHAASDRRLRALDTLNQSGRRKRTEQIEAVTAVAGFLVARFFQTDTRRCAIPTEHYLVAPDAGHIAREVSKSPEWQARGAALSVDRVYAALDNLERAGYLTKCKQTREHLPDGTWMAKPRVLAFTKQFFLHLGGQRLWNSVRAKGKALIGKVREVLPAGQLQTLLNPGAVFSPRQARMMQHRHGLPRSDSLLMTLRKMTNKARADSKLYRYTAGIAI